MIRTIIVYHRIEGCDESYLEDRSNDIDRVVLLEEIQREGNTENLDGDVGWNANDAAIVFLMKHLL